MEPTVDHEKKNINNVINTWYLDNKEVTFSCKPFKGLDTCDTLIIGGGIAGLSLKYMLDQNNISSILVEQNTIASGASGMNGGFCSSGWSLDQEIIEKKLGLKKSKEFFQISQNGLNWLKSICKECSPSISQFREGILSVHFSEKIKYLETLSYKFNENYGVNNIFLKKEDLARNINSPLYSSGILDNEAFQFNPLNVMLYMAEKLIINNNSIFEYSKVQKIKKKKSEFYVEISNGGVIKARRVVLATGGYLSEISGININKYLFKFITSIAVTEPLCSKTLKNSISTNYAIHDNRRAGNYFRFLPDGRLLWGRDIRSVGKLSINKIIKGTKKDLKKIFPSEEKNINNISFDYAWSGQLGYFSNLMPLIFKNSDNLFYITGFGGHGMNTAPAAALLIKDAILGADRNLEIFSDFRPKWNGGLLGKYSAELYLQWLKFCDL